MHLSCVIYTATFHKKIAWSFAIKIRQIFFQDICSKQKLCENWIAIVYFSICRTVIIQNCNFSPICAKFLHKTRLFLVNAYLLSIWITSIIYNLWLLLQIWTLSRYKIRFPVKNDNDWRLFSNISQMFWPIWGIFGSTFSM